MKYDKGDVVMTKGGFLAMVTDQDAHYVYASKLDTKAPLAFKPTEIRLAVRADYDQEISNCFKQVMRLEEQALKLDAYIKYLDNQSKNSVNLKLVTKERIEKDTRLN